jgi:RES domain
VAKLPRAPRSRPILTPDAVLGELTVLPPGTELVRIYYAGGPHPGGWKRFRAFGPTDARFDHHESPPAISPTRAILYAGTDFTTAVAEAFQRTRVIDVAAGEPYLAILRTSRPIRLLDLRSDWPTRAGASQELGSGCHASARNWSRAIYEDLITVEGIVWHSSMHHGGDAYALYERAENAFEASPVTNLAMATRGLALPLAHAAGALRYGLVLGPGRPAWTPRPAHGFTPAPGRSVLRRRP